MDLNPETENLEEIYSQKNNGEKIQPMAIGSARSSSRNSFVLNTISRFETQSIASIKGEDMDQLVDGIHNVKLNGDSKGRHRKERRPSNDSIQRLQDSRSKHDSERKKEDGGEDQRKEERRKRREKEKRRRERREDEREASKDDKRKSERRDRDRDRDKDRDRDRGGDRESRDRRRRKK